MVVDPECPRQACAAGRPRSCGYLTPKTLQDSGRIAMPTQYTYDNAKSPYLEGKAKLNAMLL